MLDTREHLEEGRLRHGRGDVGEQNGARRQAAGSPWRTAVRLAEIDDVKGLAGDDSHDHSEEDERNASMGVVAVDIGACGINITHGEEIELLLASPSRCIDGEENRPCDKTSQEAGDDEDLEEANKQVAVNGLVVENVLVLEILEVFYPSQEASARCGRLSLLPQVVEVGSRRVDSAEIFARDKESQHEGEGKKRSRHQGGDQTGEGV
jgi:hypothetical protein